MAPSHPWDPTGTSTPHLDFCRLGCAGNPAKEAEASQWRTELLWPGIGSHQPEAAGFLQALHIWPGCFEHTDKRPSQRGGLRGGAAQVTSPITTNQLLIKVCLPLVGRLLASEFCGIDDCLRGSSSPSSTLIGRHTNTITLYRATTLE